MGAREGEEVVDACGLNKGEGAGGAGGSDAQIFANHDISTGAGEDVVLLGVAVLGEEETASGFNAAVAAKWDGDGAVVTDDANLAVAFDVGVAGDEVGLGLVGVFSEAFAVGVPEGVFAAVANEEGARVAELGLGVVWGGFGPEKEVADDNDGEESGADEAEDKAFFRVFLFWVFGFFYFFGRLFFCHKNSYLVSLIIA